MNVVWSMDVPKVRVRNQYMVPPDEGTFGDLIRRLRMERGWSQWDLAEKVSTPDWPVAQNMISAYERGVTKNPNVDLMNRMDTAFGLPVGTILERAGWRGAKRVQERSTPPPGSVVLVDPDPAVRIMAQFLQYGTFGDPLDDTARRQLQEMLEEIQGELEKAS